jgi:hypothetical protein
MYPTFFAAKGRKLDLIGEALMVNAVWEFMLPLEGVPLPASPFFTAIGEVAPRTYVLSVVSAPLASLPVLHHRKKVG